MWHTERQQPHSRNQTPTTSTVVHSRNRSTGLAKMQRVQLLLLALGLSQALVPSLPPQRARVVTYSSEAEAISAESHEAAPAAPLPEGKKIIPPDVEARILASCW